MQQLLQSVYLDLADIKKIWIEKIWKIFILEENDGWKICFGLC